jgi:hypothetical protein
MANFFDTFIYLPLLYVVLLLTYLVGHTITVVFALSFVQPRTAIFAKILLGTIFSVVFYAIWQTKGNTMMLLFIPIALVLFTFQIQRKTESRILVFPFTEVKKSQLWFYLLLPLSYFLFRLLCIVDFDTLLLYPHWGFEDHVIYVRRADYLPFGENIGAGLQLIQKVKHEPYHYFELWLLNLLTNVTQKLSILLYDLVLFPFFLFLVLLGYLAAYEQLTIKNKTRNYILALLLVLAVSGYVDFISFGFWQHASLKPLANLFSHFNNIAFFSSAYVIKMAAVKVFLLAFLLFWLRQKPTQAFIALLALPLVNMATAPAVLSGICLFALCNFRYRWLPNLQHHIVIIASFLFLLAYTFFAWFNKTGTQVEVANFWTVQNFFNSFIASPKELLKFTEENLLHFFVYYLPFCLFLLFVTLQKPAIRLLFKHYWFLIGFFVLAILFVYACLWHIPDAHQIGKVILFAAFETLFVLYAMSYVSVKNVSDKSKAITIFIAFILVLGAAKNVFSRELGFGTLLAKLHLTNTKTKSRIPYSENYLKRVYAHLLPIYGTAKHQNNSPKGLKKLGITFCAAEDFGKQYDLGFDKKQGLAMYLNYMGNGYDMINSSLYKIDMPSVWKNDKRLENVIKNNYFVKLGEEQKANKKFVSYPQILADFIKQQKIYFGIVTKNTVIETEILPLIKMEIIDENTGERFLVFR